MSDLIAITFASCEEAQLARYEFAKMSREHLVELADSVVAYKDEKGNVQLDQTINLTRVGAAQGGFWGLLLGFLFTIPTGGLLLPIVTAVFGAGFGALTGRLSDYGINDDVMRELAADMDAGRAALFVLVRKVTTDKVLKHLAKFDGKLLKSSLPDELEAKLQQVLDKASAENAM
ncbi:MAG: DUF1269 domain-containing protein [Proteobacteria bacterium]|nr:DUF1269 domain-containing protein [Pseudomonadota bacterium]